MEKNAWWEASRFVLLTKYYSGWHITKDEMDETCGTQGEKETVYMVLVEET